MNGVFTEVESRHLSADERLHYVELGLCPPVGHELLAVMLETEKERTQDYKYQLDDANEAAGALQAELDELRERVGRLQLKATTLSETDLREELAELLD